MKKMNYTAPVAEYTVFSSFDVIQASGDERIELERLVFDGLDD